MLSRRTLLLATAATGVAAGLAAGRSPATAALPLATVSVDLGRGQGRFPFGLGRQLSAAPKSWRYGPETTTALDALRLERARVWLKYVDTLSTVPGERTFAAAYPYLDYYHARAGSLLLNWQTGYDQFAGEPGFDVDAFVAAQGEAIAHYKQRYPKITQIEVENEDFEPGETATDYYRKYVVMYRAVNGVNADIAAGRLPGPRLQVGGPALDIFSELRLDQFLDAYQADARADKQLDFISYHQYLINTGAGDWTAVKDYPAIVAGERNKLTALLGEHNLTARPAYVTEVGVFPKTRASTLGFETDLHIQAAAVASLHYWYAGQTDLVPFDWTINHPDNDRKDLFADTATGVPRPYFNALRMLSMLPATRYQATSNALNARGTGVYGLAGADAEQVAVMTWNYQWTAPAAYDSRIVLSNFPAPFRTSNVRVTRYRLDRNTHAGDLAPVETFVIGPRSAGTYYSQTLPLEPNELRLLLLTPTTDPVA